MNVRRYRTNEIADDVVGEEIRVLGWIEDKRPVGKILFLTLRDQHGKIQLVVRKKSGDVWEACDKVPRQSIVEVEGVVRRAPDKLEIEVKNMKILAKAKHPLPIDPTGRTKANLPTILDARPLSLRIPEIGAIFKIRGKVLRIIREFFYKKGFIEVNTPKIIATATEGGADLFSLDYFGKRAFLAQSPQLYKEQLMLYFEGVFEIAQFFRAEKSHTLKHLTEFTSVDVETAFTNYFNSMDMLEELIKHIFREVNKTCNEELRTLRHKLPEPPAKFRRITYDECLDLLANEGLTVSWGEDLGTDELKALAKRMKSFYFIYDWPRQTKPFYIKVKSNDPKLTESFDLMFSSLELASGGTRVNDREELERRLEEAGLNKDSFEDHLKFFDCGMPPHSGFGLGLDRLMLVLTGRENIREVTLYPRDPERVIP
ncbi:aspartate--tRNA(Asn) ligase [Candidatus Geothermarchaeota archaeon]|nr:MAG: aspartate--tRNA(Asn) ligase [Candidatus Geothermarchaeota archaeon]